VTFTQTKSSHYNRNPWDQEFVWGRKFPSGRFWNGFKLVTQIR